MPQVPCHERRRDFLLRVYCVILNDRTTSTLIKMKVIRT
jgi:hypothetical protein